MMIALATSHAVTSAEYNSTPVSPITTGSNNTSVILPRPAFTIAHTPNAIAMASNRTATIHSEPFQPSGGISHRTEYGPTSQASSNVTSNDRAGSLIAHS